MLNADPLSLPLNRRAHAALKTLGETVSQPGMPALDLLEWALRNNLTEEPKRVKAAMLQHLQLLQGMTDEKAAAYLFGEESDLDPGEDWADVLKTLLDMLHLRMTENVEDYPPDPYLP